MPTQYDIAKLKHCYQLANRFGLVVKDCGEDGWKIYRKHDTNNGVSYVGHAATVDRLQSTIYRLSETTPGEQRSPMPPSYRGPERRKK